MSVSVASYQHLRGRLLLSVRGQRREGGGVVLATLGPQPLVPTCAETLFGGTPSHADAPPPSNTYTRARAIALDTTFRPCPESAVCRGPGQGGGAGSNPFSFSVTKRRAHTQLLRRAHAPPATTCLPPRTPARCARIFRPNADAKQ